MTRQEFSDILLEDMHRRLEGPLTQAEIAEATGYSRDNICRIERESLDKLRNALSGFKSQDQLLSDILSDLGLHDG